MWFKDFFLHKLVPTFVNMIPALFGGLYENSASYEIITVPLVVCFGYGVILIITGTVEYTQEIVGRIKNKRLIKRLKRSDKK